jgi:anti-sigma regulatory factor (Ser/Thr protein kinase)
MSPVSRRMPPPLFTWTASTSGPAALARAALRQALVQRGLPDDIIDDAVLAVSELVANASEHATAPYELRLRETVAEIICEVLDGDSRIPRIPHRSAAAPFAPKQEDRGGGLDALQGVLSERGRGLQIVEYLSGGCWGFKAARPIGKIAWLAIPLQRSVREEVGLDDLS